MGTGLCLVLQHRASPIPILSTLKKNCRTSVNHSSLLRERDSNPRPEDYESSELTTALPRGANVTTLLLYANIFLRFFLVNKKATLCEWPLNILNYYDMK